MSKAERETEGKSKRRRRADMSEAAYHIVTLSRRIIFVVNN